MIDRVRISNCKTDLVNFSESFITEKYIGWLNNKSTMRYSNQRFLTHDVNSCRKYLESFSNTTNLFFAILDIQTQEHIGTLTAYISDQHKIADVGILVGEESTWGKGYGIDAWMAMLNYLFDKKHMRKVTAGTVRSNIGMLKIMEKSGMQLEAIRPKHLVFDGVEEDVLLYAKFAQ